MWNQVKICIKDGKRPQSHVKQFVLLMTKWIDNIYYKKEQQKYTIG